MDKIYHYTSVNGFKGIASDKTIRMTRSEFLNDPYDCHLFIEMINTFLNDNKNIVDCYLNDKNFEKASELYNKKECDLISYIKYIQKNISLYVMSLTEQEDEMSMWNYYGNGGVQFEFKLKELELELSKILKSDEEYLFSSKVIYTNSKTKLEEINPLVFFKYKLMNKECDNIFEQHKNSLKEKNNKNDAPLYYTEDLAEFIKTYVRGYFESINFLLTGKIITIDTPKEEIFKSVFDNTKKLTDSLIWKKDMNLYMISLLSLIKSDTYKHENEYRIVYFNNDILQSEAKKQSFDIKKVNSNNFLYPYVSFESDALIKTISSVTLSPMTNNLSIDCDVYKETIYKFLLSNNFDSGVNVELSKHKIRW